MSTSASASFVPLDACWICGGTSLDDVFALRFDFSDYGGQDPALAAYTGAQLALRRCAACGFAQPEALPTLPNFFDRMYDQRWSADWLQWDFESGHKEAIFASVLRGLAARLPEGRRRLLDVGAHTGRFMVMASDRGWLAEGVELNPRAAAFAAERTGRTVWRVNVHALDRPGEYDAITLTDVLEHVPRPVEVLARVAGLLAPGGWVAVKVPCGPAQVAKERWRARLQPGYRATLGDNLVHVNHFSPRALALALTRAGFTDVHIDTAVPELPPGSHWRDLLSRSVRRGIHAAATVMPFALHTPLTLHLQAYARRPRSTEGEDRP